ncbi:MAG TPA: haloalkane dehalogenase [Acidimicrobiia bacterium]
MAIPKKHLSVLGSRMAYVEVGRGRPILLLHGNPTSSFLWRDVIPELDGHGRCIAPDLIGMGDSAKIDSLYRFVDHRHYLDGLMEELRLDADLVLVGHDWGGALLFDWASRHPHAVAGIVYMETIVAPLEWEDWPESARKAFQAMRSDAGEEMVLGRNFFVERIFPASVLKPLGTDVMEEYRRPFPNAATRAPTLRWPREIPIGGTPVDMVELVARYSTFMAETDIPKLFVNADPGSILTGAQRELVRTWPNQREVTVPGVHFIQEDSGPEIGRAIAEFVDSL